MESTIGLTGMFYIDFVVTGNDQIALEKINLKKKVAFVKENKFPKPLK